MYYISGTTAKKVRSPKFASEQREHSGFVRKVMMMQHFRREVSLYKNNNTKYTSNSNSSDDNTYAFSKEINAYYVQENW